MRYLGWMKSKRAQTILGIVLFLALLVPGWLSFWGVDMESNSNNPGDKLTSMVQTMFSDRYRDKMGHTEFQWVVTDEAYQFFFTDTENNKQSAVLVNGIWLDTLQ